MEWQALPTEPGWYWYRLGTPTAQTILCTEVLLLDGVLCSVGGDNRIKPVDQFRRVWAGPLPRPAERAG